MSSHDVFRRLYDEELSWRSDLTTAIGLPVGLVTLIGGVLGLYLRSFADWRGPWGWWFGAALGVATVFFVLAIVCLVRARHGYNYERIPYPADIRKYFVQLRNYHAAAGTSELLDAEFMDWLDDRLVQAADRNVRNNLNKSRHLYWAMTWIICALVAVAVAVPPFLLADVRAVDPPLRVEIQALDSLLEVYRDDRLRLVDAGSADTISDSIRPDPAGNSSEADSAR